MTRASLISVQLSSRFTFLFGQVTFKDAGRRSWRVERCDCHGAEIGVEIGEHQDFWGFYAASG